MFKRDLTERIDHFIAKAKSWNDFAEWLRHGLDRIFLNSPLRPLKKFLSGKWLEHPLHPVLTDVPIGAWLLAIVLDLAARVAGAPNLGIASAIAIGLGILGALAAIATGFLDWQDLESRELRIGLVHAAFNVAATVLFTVSFIGRWMVHWQIDAFNASLAVVGYLILTGGAFLGGTLVFRMGATVNRNAFVNGPKEFVSVLAMKDLHENQATRVNADGVPVLLVRRGEEVYALGAVCSHLGAPLEEGKFTNGSIECPWHYSRFAIEDGRVITGPATSPMPVFETRISRDQIQVRLKQSM